MKFCQVERARDLLASSVIPYLCLSHDSLAILKRMLCNITCDITFDIGSSFSSQVMLIICLGVGPCIECQHPYCTSQIGIWCNPRVLQTANRLPS